MLCSQSTETKIENASNMRFTVTAANLVEESDVEGEAELVLEPDLV
jgi:hypothetical protein